MQAAKPSRPASAASAALSRGSRSSRPGSAATSRPSSRGSDGSDDSKGSSRAGSKTGSDGDKSSRQTSSRGLLGSRGSNRSIPGSDDEASHPTSKEGSEGSDERPTSRERSGSRFSSLRSRPSSKGSSRPSSAGSDGSGGSGGSGSTGPQRAVRGPSGRAADRAKLVDEELRPSSRGSDGSDGSSGQASGSRQSGGASRVSMSRGSAAESRGSGGTRGTEEVELESTGDIYTDFQRKQALDTTERDEYGNIVSGMKAGVQDENSAFVETLKNAWKMMDSTLEEALTGTETAPPDLHKYAVEIAIPLTDLKGDVVPGKFGKEKVGAWFNNKAAIQRQFDVALNVDKAELFELTDRRGHRLDNVITASHYHYKQTMRFDGKTGEWVNKDTLAERTERDFNEKERQKTRRVTYHTHLALPDKALAKLGSKLENLHPNEESTQGARTQALGRHASKLGTGMGRVAERMPSKLRVPVPTALVHRVPESFRDGEAAWTLPAMPLIGDKVVSVGIPRLNRVDAAKKLPMLKRREVSALRIQTCWRMHLGKKELKRRVKIRENEIMTMFALKIQRKMRRWLEWRAHRDERCAIVTQKFYRGHMVRTRVNKMRKVLTIEGYLDEAGRAEALEAAAEVSSVAVAIVEKEIQLQVDSAAYIQRAYRGLRGRRRLAYFVFEAHEDAVMKGHAVVPRSRQNVSRGALQGLPKWKEEDAAANKLQNMFRKKNLKFKIKNTAAKEVRRERRGILDSEMARQEKASREAQALFGREPTLCEAVQGKWLHIVRQHLTKMNARESGVVNRTDQQGRSPVLIATACNHEEILEELLEFWKADPNVAGPGGRTALHVAATHGRRKSVELLLQYRVDINQVDDWGQSALHLCARLPPGAGGNLHLHDALGVCRLLMEKGADMYVSDCRGETAVARAQRLNRDGLVWSFLDHCWRYPLQWRRLPWHDAPEAAQRRMRLHDSKMLELSATGGKLPPVDTSLVSERSQLMLADRTRVGGGEDSILALQPDTSDLGAAAKLAPLPQWMQSADPAAAPSAAAASSAAAAAAPSAVEAAWDPEAALEESEGEEQVRDVVSRVVDAVVWEAARAEEATAKALLQELQEGEKQQAADVRDSSALALYRAEEDAKDAQSAAATSELQMQMTALMDSNDKAALAHNLLDATTKELFEQSRQLALIGLDDDELSDTEGPDYNPQSGWIEYFDVNGRPYYYHPQSDTTSWDEPEEGICETDRESKSRARAAADLAWDPEAALAEEDLQLAAEKKAKDAAVAEVKRLKDETAAEEAARLAEVLSPTKGNLSSMNSSVNMDASASENEQMLRHAADALGIDQSMMSTLGEDEWGMPVLADISEVNMLDMTAEANTAAKENELRESKQSEAEQLLVAMKYFNEYDADGSGSIDVRELRGLLQHLKYEFTNEASVAQVFREVDTDNSGEVDFLEFARWWKSTKEAHSSSSAATAMQRMRARRRRKQAPQAAAAAATKVADV